MSPKPPSRLLSLFAPASPAVAPAQAEPEPAPAPTPTPQVSSSPAEIAAAQAETPSAPTAPTVPTAPSGPPVRTWRVAEILREVKRALDTTFPGDVVIAGEISQLKRWRNGHWYFDLKDDDALLPCVMFFNKNQRLQFDVQDGLAVKVRGKISMQPGRAGVQIVVDGMKPVGAGALALRFEMQKKKFEGEGLFELARKRPLPLLPRVVGIVTSPQSAALQDVLKVIRERMPKAHVVIAGSRVQGDGAAADVAEALRRLDALKLCDVILVVRGGGSLEDLWAFNEEPVLRAVFHCSVPVVSGVGHETDTTLCDLVADARAPTPSVAASLAVPREDDLRRRIEQARHRLQTKLSGRLSQTHLALFRLERRLGAPGELTQRAHERLAALDERLEASTQQKLQAAAALLADKSARLQTQSPRLTLATRRQRLHEVATRLASARPHARVEAHRVHLSTTLRRLDDVTRARARAARGRYDTLAATLSALSPLAALVRGYAVVRRVEDGAVVRRAADVAKGDVVTARVGAGEFTAVVDTVKDAAADGALRDDDA